jgi:ATP-binding cassette subfamily C protein LapB
MEVIDVEPQRVTEKSVSAEDSLLSCLQLITHLHGLPCNIESVLAGLPLVNGHLTPELYVRAADRAGVSAKVIERENLADISEIVLPVVLLLANDKACVLLEMDLASHRCTVQDNLSTASRQIILPELQSQYIGHAIFCKPVSSLSPAGEKETWQDRHWLWSAVAHSWRIYRDVLLATLLINIFATVSPLFTMNIYNRVVPNQAIETLWVLTLGISLVYVFDLLVKTLRVYFLEIAGKKADVLMSSRIFEHILGIRMEHQPASVGNFISQLREFESVRNFITSSTVVALIDLPFTILFLLIILYVGGWLVLVPLLIAPLMVAYGFFMQPALRRAVESGYRAANRKHAALTEAISQRETIKTLVVEGHWQRLWENLVGELAISGQRGRLLTSGVSNVCNLLTQLATVLMVFAGVYLIGAGKLSMGGLIASVMLASRVLGPMSQVVNLQASYFQTRTAVAGISQTMMLPLERPPARNFLNKDAITGDIEFRDVSFQYSQDGPTVLNKISFKIRAGEKVAVIGRIGSGKSTLQKLVMGLYQPTAGMVLIDGVDLRQLDPAFVRKSMAHVSQDFTLFEGSIRHNITIGELERDDERLARVVAATGVNELVRESSIGLDMPVGERGASLSGGQRQSVMLARALYRKAAVYLLDEPTSQLDSGSEDALRRQLPDWLGNATVLLTTHKGSMVDLADRLIVLDRGRLVADGPRQMVLDALQRGEVRVSGASS